MDWIPWILASALFLSLYDIAKKASVRDNAVLPTLLFSTVFGCAAFLAGLALSGNMAAVASVTRRIALLSAVKSLIVSTSWVFTFCALRTLPISIATPIRASAPAIVFFVAMFLYSEIPTPLQALGMCSVFAGYMAFSWAGRHEGIDFWRNKAVWCAIGGAICSAMSSLWDKYLFQTCGANVESVQFCFQIGLVVAYLAALCAVRLYGRLAGRDPGRRFEWRNTIPFVGILLALADWLYFTGLSRPGAPISAGSLMRRFSVAITFLVGARIFHEQNLTRKAVALALILSGTILLCFAYR